MVLLVGLIMNLRKDSDQLFWVKCPLLWPVVGGREDRPPESHCESKVAVPDRAEYRTEKIKYLTPQKISCRLELYSP